MDPKLPGPSPDSDHDQGDQGFFVPWAPAEESKHASIVQLGATDSKASSPFTDFDNTAGQYSLLREDSSYDINERMENIMWETAAASQSEPQGESQLPMEDEQDFDNEDPLEGEDVESIHSSAQPEEPSDSDVVEIDPGPQTRRLTTSKPSKRRISMKPNSRDVNQAMEIGLQQMIGVNRLTRSLYPKIVERMDRIKKKMLEAKSEPLRPAYISMDDLRALFPEHSGEPAQESALGAQQTTDPHSYKAIWDEHQENRKRNALPDNERLKTAIERFKDPPQEAGQDDGSKKWKMQGLRTLLMGHQVEAIGWMRDREKMKKSPCGGLLAHAMGLGKTIMALANIADDRPVDSAEFQGPTLIVTPLAVLEQWEEEIRKHCEPQMFGDFQRYDRKSIKYFELWKKEIEKKTVILASYEDVRISYPDVRSQDELKERSNETLLPELQSEVTEWWIDAYPKLCGFLHNVKWHRIILDEGQRIRNHDTKLSGAVRALAGKYRWILSGTPVYNWIEEFYAHFNFLRIPESMIFEGFLHVFCQGKKQSQTRLISTLQGIMHQRTYSDQLFGHPIVPLPTMTKTRRNVEFCEAEMLFSAMIDARIQKLLRTTGYQKENSVEKGPRGSASAILAAFNVARMISSHLLTARKFVKDTLDSNAPILERLKAMAEGRYSTDPQSVLVSQYLLKAYYADEYLIRIEHMKRKVPAICDILSGNLNELIEGWTAKVDKLRSAENTKEFQARTSCYSCNEIPSQAFITSCEHIYCNRCFLEVLRKCNKGEQYRPFCPSCRETFYSAAYCNRTERLNRTPKEFFETTEEPPKKRKKPSSGTQLENPRKQRKRKAVKRISMFEHESSDESDNDATADWVPFVGPDMPSAKLDIVRTMIKKWLEEDSTSKVIVFANFLDTIQLLELMCAKEGWVSTKLSSLVPIKNRAENIEKFQLDKEIKIIISTEHVGGVGISLAAANKCIVMEPWWNDAIDSQAFSRLYRIGQTRDVECVKIWANSGIDKRVEQLQEKKLKQINEASGPSSIKKLFTEWELSDSWAGYEIEDEAGYQDEAQLKEEDPKSSS